jgi:hypothetical protein
LNAGYPNTGTKNARQRQGKEGVGLLYTWDMNITKLVVVVVADLKYRLRY